MKICICSDSHGNSVGLQDALEIERPQVLLFLGDGERDFRDVDIPGGTRVISVAGNCDYMSPEPPWRLIELAGKRIFFTHGHTFGVKFGTERLLARGKEAGADLVLHGHTHQMDVQEADGMILLCPGSIGVQTRNYAVAEIENGQITCAFREL